MYYAERGDWDDHLGAFLRPDGSLSPMQSIIATFYWCIITMCTVGCARARARKHFPFAPHIRHMYFPYESRIRHVHARVGAPI